MSCASLNSHIMGGLAFPFVMKSVCVYFSWLAFRQSDRADGHFMATSGLLLLSGFIRLVLSKHVEFSSRFPQSPMMSKEHLCVEMPGTATRDLGRVTERNDDRVLGIVSCLTRRQTSIFVH